MKKTIALLIMLTLSFVGTISVYADNSQQDRTDYGTAGSIMGTARNPEEGDTSNWLTLQAGEIGVRVVNREGNELIAVDNFGGIYLNGDVYIKDQKLEDKLTSTEAEERRETQIGNGFLYFLLVVSLFMNCWCVNRLRKVK